MTDYENAKTGERLEIEYYSDENDNPRDDSAYDAWADNRVEEFYFRLEERISIMKELVELWKDESTHTNNVDKRDELEKQLVQNLTGDKKNWQSINSIHDKWGSFSFGKYH